MGGWGLSSDGTSEGTHAFSLPFYADHAIGDQSKIYVGTPNGSVPAIWESDGTPEGTRELVNFASVAGYMDSLALIDGNFYFITIQGPTHRHEAYRWTPGNTDPVRLGTFAWIDWQGFVPYRGGALFTAQPLGNVPFELWATDGTASTLRRVAALGPDFPRARAYTALGERALALEESWYGGHRLVAYEPDGRVALLAAPESPFTSNVLDFKTRAFFHAGNRLFVVYATAEHGVELWITDGTPAGTRLVRDIAPGALSSYPHDIRAIGNGIAFLAWSPEYGHELWYSDGTTEGTRLVGDVAPGIASSSPSELVASRDRLYWIADDGVHGRELWTADLPALRARRR